MKNNKLKVLSSVLILLRERGKSIDRKEIIDNNDALKEALIRYAPRIDVELLMYLYAYLYDHSDNIENQFVTYNEKSNGFTIFEAHPTDEDIPKYEYVKISLSRDPSIPIRTEQIEIELDRDRSDGVVSRTMSMSLPEYIELVRLESEKRTIKGKNIKRLIEAGRSLPPKTAMYRSLEDLGLITIASTTNPLQRAVSMYIQDTKGIETIKPAREIDFENAKTESNNFWKNSFERIDKDTNYSYYTRMLLEEMTKYQKDKRSPQFSVEKPDKNKYREENKAFDNEELEDSVLEFIDNFRKKSEDFGEDFEYSESKEDEFTNFKGK